VLALARDDGWRLSLFSADWEPVRALLHALAGRLTRASIEALDRPSESEAALMLRAGSSRVAIWRSGMTRPVPLGGCADGGAVVMGCDESLACGGGAVERVGAVWLVQIGLAGGHFEMLGFAVGGPAGGDVVTELSH
jgi:hypothetical protein